MDQEQLFQLLQSHGTFGEPLSATTGTTETGAGRSSAATNTGASTTRTAAAIADSTPFSDEQLGSLRDILANIQVPQDESSENRNRDISLTDVLKPDALRPIFSNPQIASAVFPHLPPNIDPTTEELMEVIHSPQFHQSLASLTYALQTGQLGPLLSELGIDPSINSVESFLHAIEEQARREERHDDDNLDDQNPDRMDED
jgi:hypothetical protein